MNDTPLVSIITPSYNQAEFLERTIRSVLAQDYPNIEYILIDGNSTDGTYDVIQRYKSQISKWVSEPDKGQTDAINKGFGIANGEILAWLNSDDTLEPGAVSSAVSWLNEHPEVGLVYGDCHFIDANDAVIGKFNAKQTNLKKLCQGFVHIPQQASFFRAALWKEVGPLDDSFFFAMDYDLWTRLASVSEIRYLPGNLWANFRLHGDAKTISADDRCWPEMLRVHRRNGGSVFSVITAKYYLRKVLAPVINRRRRKLFENR